MGQSEKLGPLGKTLSTTDASDQGADSPAYESRLVVVFEADRPRASAASYGLTRIHTIRIGRGHERTAERDGAVLTVRVPDRRMSSQHAEVQLLLDRWRLKDLGSRNGCFVDGQRVEAHDLKNGEFLELGRSFFLIQPDCRRGEGDGEVTEMTAPAPGLVTLHPDLRTEISRVAKLATTPVSFLIQGESGTGKEVMARALHTLSGRSGEFVAVNTAAIPASLVESELFGHRKGAFSGAVSDRVGLIRSADRGTLFLDEIGDLPLPAQAVLLRVLQEREVRPVGDTRTIPVDIRLVSASHKDLLQRVKRDQFRQDLYARIAGMQISLPPLRRRRIDLGILIAALLPRLVENPKELTFSIDAARALLRHDWPMNIRELENCLLTAAALADAGRIEHSHLPARLGQATGDPDPNSTSDPESLASPSAAHTPVPAPRKPVNVSKDEILAALAENDNNIAHTARALGMSRQALYRRMQRFDIPRPGRARYDPS